MKINDIVLSEAPMNAQQLRAAQDAAAGKPPTPAPAPASGTKKGTAKFDPAVQARQKELIAAGAKIKADGFMGPATRAAEKQFGAQIDTAKAQTQQGQPGPTTVTNPAQATQADPDGDMADRGKVDAMAGADAGDQTSSGYTAQSQAQRTANARDANTTADQATATQTQTSNYTGVDQRTANARDANAAPPVAGYANKEDPARIQQLAGVPPNTNALGVTAQSGNVFGQPAPTPDKPNTQTGQAAQPNAPIRTAQDFAGTGTSTQDPTVAPPVATGKDGTGPGLKDGSGKPVTSSSDDELAWVAKNGGPMANRSMYPGPGNWDPKTGRTTKAADKALAASGANPWDGKDPAKAAAWAALSPEDQKWIGKGDPTDKFILARAPSKGGFLGSITPNFMKKDKGQPAPGPQNAPPVNPPPGFAESVRELDRIKKLSGLR